MALEKNLTPRICKGASWDGKESVAWFLFQSRFTLKLTFSSFYDLILKSFLRQMQLFLCFCSKMSQNIEEMKITNTGTFWISGAFPWL